MSNIEKFIVFVNDLTTDIFYEKLYTTGEVLYFRGGCYILAQIIKNYYPSCDIVLSKYNDHCGVLYKGEVYDATGKVENKDDFAIANEEDILYMEDRFGGQLVHLNIYEVITKEIENIGRMNFLFENGDKVLKKD